jgi:hypothetical protein
MDDPHEENAKHGGSLAALDHVMDADPPSPPELDRPSLEGQRGASRFLRVATGEQ